MSIKGLSSGALFAKVKACSTELLSEEDYIKASSCADLSDFASFLKAQRNMKHALLLFCQHLLFPTVLCLSNNFACLCPGSKKAFMYGVYIKAVRLGLY